MSSVPKKIPVKGHLRVIAPASSAKDWSKFHTALHVFKELGFSVSFGKNLRKKKKYLAGSDTQRLSDLHDAFRDPSVDAIFTLRGGYGTTRLLNQIDFSLIKKNPKPIIGFSDITALQLAILKKTKVGSYSGPAFLSVVRDKRVSEFSIMSFLRAAVAHKKKIDLLALPSKYMKSVTVIKPGAAKGMLVGGNLSLLCSLVGTPYLPSLQGTILFLEEVNEAPYRMDRLLTQLILSGVLKGVQAVLCGKCHGCDDVTSLFKERLSILGIPLVVGLPFGHIDDLITFPIGAFATLRAGKKISLIV